MNLFLEYAVPCESERKNVHLVKKRDTKLLFITSPSINRFSIFLQDGLSIKFATNLCLNIPLCLKHVATLRCEI